VKGSRESNQARDDGSDAEPFGSWLLLQVRESDWIGELARAAKADRTFPKGGSAEEVRQHLLNSKAEADMLEAVDDAENTWLRR